MKIAGFSIIRNRSVYKAIGLNFLISAVFIAISLLFHLWKHVPVANFSADITVIAGIPPYFGFLSQVGLFFWASTSVICFFSFIVLSKKGGEKKQKQFFLFSALLTLLLTFDDAFLLHEVFFPYIGVSEKVVYLFYFSAVLVHLHRFYTTIANTNFILLGMAFCFLGLSVGLDLITIPGINPYFFEDGAKFVGIVSWTSYFFNAGVYALSNSVAQEGKLGKGAKSEMQNNRQSA